MPKPGPSGPATAEKRSWTAPAKRPKPTLRGWLLLLLEACVVVAAAAAATAAAAVLMWVALPTRRSASLSRYDSRA